MNAPKSQNSRSQHVIESSAVPNAAELHEWLLKHDGRRNEYVLNSGIDGHCKERTAGNASNALSERESHRERHARENLVWPMASEDAGWLACPQVSAAWFRCGANPHAGTTRNAKTDGSGTQRQSTGAGSHDVSIAIRTGESACQV